MSACKLVVVAFFAVAIGCKDGPRDYRLERSISGIPRAKFKLGNAYLIIELLDDDLAHFELSAVGKGPEINAPIYATPMVAGHAYSGPSSAQIDDDGLETPELRLDVNPQTLCVHAFDKIRNVDLTTLCPVHLDEEWKGLTLSKGSMTHAYGLGEQFLIPGSAVGDWVGTIRSAGGPDGNAMTGFNGGGTGNAQFPVLYALGNGQDGYALFLDQAYKQEWDFTGKKWQARMWGDQIRGYLMSGPDLPDLRRDYMELVGRPPVPPLRAFGLWISEYGFDDWKELEGKLDGLRGDHFPVDGFALDLQWFGNVEANSDFSKMGTLRFDETHFPNPAGKIAELRTQGGVELMPIEESYVSRGLPEHDDLQQRGFLARDSENGPATYIVDNPWWGKGGMIDWSNDAAGDYWHDLKRQPLIDLGVVAHWTDLGEPEMYNWWAWYHGFPELGKFRHADVHNVFALKWIESIARGYARHGVSRRPFMLSRSGTSGIQRYGAAMWSGDIGSNLSSLATHHHVQMHMSLSGIDYFGADIGGFHRGGLKSDLKEMFTQWFANGMLFDVPGRTHTENLCNCKETAPNQIGDFTSNLHNARLRYRLSPYVYSLAHRAFRSGEAVFPPLVYYFQSDDNVRSIAHEKMIGPNLLGAIVAGVGESERDVYLPAGSWIDFYSNEWFTSSGQWIKGIPEYRGGRFKLPLFARAGAILPMRLVDDQTMNISGRRLDGSRRDDLIVRVYASEQASTFTLFEDDGQTVAYRDGEFRETLITQKLTAGTAVVTVGAGAGNYAGAVAARAIQVELVMPDRVATGVLVDGQAVPELAGVNQFDAAEVGWIQAGRNLVRIKAGKASVTVGRSFEVTSKPAVEQATVGFSCLGAEPGPQEGVFVIGSVDPLGNWAAQSAVELAPTAPGKWGGIVTGLPLQSVVEWKCIIRDKSGGPVLEWEPGANGSFSTDAGGFVGTQIGSF